MSRKSIHSSSGEPSFFYLLMAESCFRRAAKTRHTKGRGTLRDLGRTYLAKACDVGSVLEPRKAA
jgi:hypothetical protein